MTDARAGRLAGATLALGLFGSTLSAAPPDLSGAWQRLAAASDDAVARIEAVAGPAQPKGGERDRLFLPGGGGEMERVELRSWLLAAAERLGRLEIEQSPVEVKLFQGEDAVSIFYFGRDHVRESGRGVKLRCRVRWEGEQLVVEEEGSDKSRISQLLTLLPAAGQLLHVLRFEHPRLSRPLEVQSRYERALVP